MQGRKDWSLESRVWSTSSTSIRSSEGLRYNKWLANVLLHQVNDLRPLQELLSTDPVSTGSVQPSQSLRACRAES